MPGLPLPLIRAGSGLDTHENLALGLVLALAGTAQALVGHLQQMTESPCRLYLPAATPSYWPSAWRGPAEVRPELTLDGLRLAHEATSGP